MMSRLQKGLIAGFAATVAVSLLEIPNLFLNWFDPFQSVIAALIGMPDALAVGWVLHAVAGVLILKSSFWAKRQFIRAQYARPKWVYPFRRLMRKKPEFAPVFWQQALRAEKVILTRRRRGLIRLRKGLRRYIRKLFR